MLISQAYAQAVDAAAVPTPNPLWNLGMLVVMIALFYLLLIRPQQKRFKEHSQMLSALEKGDAVVTGGGLIGKVAKIVNDDEVEVDLGNKIVVTVKRSTISGKVGDAPAAIKAAEKPAKKTTVKAAATATTEKAEDAKPAAKKKAPAKKATAKKTTAKAAAKKTPAKKKPAAKKTTAKKAANDKA